MTPLPLLTVPASQEPHQSSPDMSGDRPERSRNAKAQARHRAKRKAYIHQLEQTVVRLQQALQLSPDQHVAPIPPPVRVRELEEENIALHREIELLRRQLDERNARLRPDIHQRSPDAPPLDTRTYDREYKHCRQSFSYENDLQAQTGSPSQLSSPTGLAMPGMNYNYSHSPASPSMGQERSSPLPAAPTYGYPYHMPETPPSSSTSTPSTPSFSPTDHYGNYAQRASLSSVHTGHQTYQHGTVGHYGGVKVEEEAYPLPQPSHDIAHANGYSSAVPLYGTHQHALNQWSYPDRNQAHETYERLP